MTAVAIAEWFDSLTEALLDASGAPWMLAALFALTVADALLPILPSETAVVALGTLSAAGGETDLSLIIPVAALGALAGDLLLFGIGRGIGTTRWAWMRRPRVAAAFAWARRGLDRRAATLILTARYVPLGRIAVSVTAGASGFGFKRYLPISAIACVSWALYNVGVGALFGTWLSNVPILAVAISVAVAVSAGIVIDAIVSRVSDRRSQASNGAATPEPGNTERTSQTD